MLDDFIPKDNEYYREFYEKQNKGSCGIACLAVFFKKNIKAVLNDDFKNYNGHMSIRNLHSLLILKYNLQCKWRNNHRKKTITVPPDKVLFARIQWVGRGGRFHGYSSWHEATCNTHFILIDSDRYFTNDGGWAEIRWLPEYLEHGYITSFLEVERAKC